MVDVNMTTEQAGALAVLAGAGLAMGLVVIALYVLLVIAQWKMFKKMGEPGWKAIIPFYNSYILYKRTWATKIFWIVLAIGIVAGICNSVALNNPDGAAIWSALYSILTLAAFVFGVIANHKISKSFGHGAGFTVGLVLLTPIFMLILGFGSSQYIGNTTEQQ